MPGFALYVIGKRHDARPDNHIGSPSVRKTTQDESKMTSLY